MCASFHMELFYVDCVNKFFVLLFPNSVIKILHRQCKHFICVVIRSELHRWVELQKAGNNESV